MGARRLSSLVWVACLLVGAPAFGQGLPPVQPPPGNPITLAKVNLGKALFWDEQVSSTRTVACGTCHIPAFGGSDPRSLQPGLDPLHPGADGIFFTTDDVKGSPGVVANDAAGFYLGVAPFHLRPAVTGRKSPPMIDAAFATSLFWDGRASQAFVDPDTGAPVFPFNAALESQAVEPPLSDVEMAHQGRGWSDVVQRLTASEPLALASNVPVALESWIAGRSYPELFETVFGSPGVSAARFAIAVATYQRTLISSQTPFDLFQQGSPDALSDQELAGLNLFNGKALCVQCHPGPITSDFTFHNIGVEPSTDDLGLGAITGLPEDRGKFKVPVLRNVVLRAPFFHDGSAATVADVIEFYDRGGDFHDDQSDLIEPLNLTAQEKADLEAFLTTGLLDPRVANELPPFDRPTLYAETAAVPALVGPAGAGSGGIAPRAIAVEPPMLGNDSLTIAIADALGGSIAFLALDGAAAPPGTVLFGTPLHLGLSPALAVLPLGVLPGAGPGEGHRSAVLDVPVDPTLDGATLHAQWFVVDLGSPGGLLASSEGIALTFFPPGG